MARLASARAVVIARSHHQHPPPKDRNSLRIERQERAILVNPRAPSGTRTPSFKTPTLRLKSHSRPQRSFAVTEGGLGQRLSACEGVRGASCPSAGGVGGECPRRTNRHPTPARSKSAGRPPRQSAAALRSVTAVEVSARTARQRLGLGTRVAVVAWIACFGLLVARQCTDRQALDLFDSFFRAGSLALGGDPWSCR